MLWRMAIVQAGHEDKGGLSLGFNLPPMMPVTTGATRIMFFVVGDGYPKYIQNRFRVTVTVAKNQKTPGCIIGLEPPQ